MTAPQVRGVGRADIREDLQTRPPRDFFTRCGCGVRDTSPVPLKRTKHIHTNSQISHQVEFVSIGELGRCELVFQRYDLIEL